jgi:hypothetical protein
MNNLKTKLALAILAGCLGGSASAPAQTTNTSGAAEISVDAGNLRAFIELARSDLKTQKTLIISQNIQFTADEAVEFWPLHSEYTVQLNKLLDQRLALLEQYAATYQNMTDAQATSLAKKIFDWEEKRVDLKRTWFKKFSKVVPAKKAAQFFQIENQLNAVLDLKLAAALPLIK